MLKVLKVYRYRRSGKLIATGLGNGYVLPLNSDLTFSSKEPHRVRRGTEFDATPYRIEVELVVHGNEKAYQVVRTWNENHLPRKSEDPNDPIEQRIDISPSEQFGEAEKKYVGQSKGHPIGFVLMVGSLFLILMVEPWGWWPPLATLTVGFLIYSLTKTPGNTSRIFEVKEAKERLRQMAEHKLHEAMSDVHAWVALDGVEFERAVARIYNEQGFNVEFTPRTNDQGADLILRKDDRISIVQCKAYTNNVGVNAVRELVGVRSSWPNTPEAILVTLFDFSGAAKDFAAEQNIKLFSVAREYLKTDYRPES